MSFILSHSKKKKKKKPKINIMGNINTTKLYTILNINSYINQVVTKSLEETSPRKKMNFFLREWRWITAVVTMMVLQT